MAEAAGHADAIRPHKVLAVVIAWIGVIALGVPGLLRRFIEGGVREQAQAQDARRVAVERTDRHGLAARADGDAWIFLRVLERIGRAGRIALVEPQAEAVGVGAGRLVEAGLVDHAEIGPA